MRKIACLALIVFCFACGSGNFSFSGIVTKIEWGKDGYNAIIRAENGDSVSATISRNDMKIGYKELEIGEYVKVIEDSLHLGNENSVYVKRIK